MGADPDYVSFFVTREGADSESLQVLIKILTHRFEVCENQSVFFFSKKIMNKTLHIYTLHIRDDPLSIFGKVYSFDFPLVCYYPKLCWFQDEKNNNKKIYPHAKSLSTEF